MLLSLQCLLLLSAGALPDQIEFSKNCRTILVSNEGEPDCYDQPSCSDPEGSVSVITLRPVYTSSNGKRCKAPRAAAAAADASPATFSRQCTLSSVEGTVRTADFKAWNDKREQLIKQGVVLDAPNGATVAQDLEPEYTTFSADEKIAFVSIQVKAVVKVMFEARCAVSLRCDSACLAGLVPCCKTIDKLPTLCVTIEAFIAQTVAVNATCCFMRVCYTLPQLSANLQEANALLVAFELMAAAN
jgi:hypothetical protein